MVLNYAKSRYESCVDFVQIWAAHDILRLSSDRPLGLRGALVELYLCHEGSCKRLAQVVADPRQEVKTLIKMTLHQDETSDPATLHLRSGYTMERCCLP